MHTPNKTFPPTKSPQLSPPIPLKPFPSPRPHPRFLIPNDAFCVSPLRQQHSPNAHHLRPPPPLTHTLPASSTPRPPPVPPSLTSDPHRAPAHRGARQRTDNARADGEALSPTTPCLPRSLCQRPLRRHRRERTSLLAKQPPRSRVSSADADAAMCDAHQRRERTSASCDAPHNATTTRHATTTVLPHPAMPPPLSCPAPTSAPGERGGRAADRHRTAQRASAQRASARRVCVEGKRRGCERGGCEPTEGASARAQRGSAQTASVRRVRAH